MKPGWISRSFVSGALALTVLLAVCASAQDSGAGSPAPVVLGPGDQFRLKVPTVDGMSGVFTVEEDGIVRLPLAAGIDFGSVNVKGLTVHEAEKAIADLVAVYYRDPSATIEPIVTSAKIGSQVTAAGYIASPGVYRYQTGMKALDLLALAGTFSQESDPTRSLLYRKDAEFPLRLDLEKLFTGDAPGLNIELREGDTLVIPKRLTPETIEILVLGNVTSPGSVQIKEGSRLMDGIAAAHGFFGRAAVGRTYILRMVDGRPTAIHADVKELMKNADLMQNVPLRDGDILFVPESSRVDVDGLLQNLTQFNILTK